MGEVGGNSDSSERARITPKSVPHQKMSKDDYFAGDTTGFYGNKYKIFFGCNNF